MRITETIFAAYLASLDAAAVREIQAQIAVDACEGEATNSKWGNRVWGELPLDQAFEATSKRLEEVEDGVPVVRHILFMLRGGRATGETADLMEDAGVRLRALSDKISDAEIGNALAQRAAFMREAISLLEKSVCAARLDSIDNFARCIDQSVGIELLKCLFRREDLFRGWTPTDASEAAMIRDAAHLAIQRTRAFA